MVTIALAAATCLLCSASTSAPAGTWLTIAVMVPALRASPISPWVQRSLVR